MKNTITYVLPRPFHGYNIPLAIQNTYIREYASNSELVYSLSAVELTKNDCFEILKKNVISMNKDRSDFLVVSGLVFPINNQKKMEDIFLNSLKYKKARFHLILESKILNNKELIEWSSELSFIKKISMNYNEWKLKKKKLF